MFLLEEAGPLKLDQFERVSSVNLARHFLNFFYKKKKKFFRWCQLWGWNERQMVGIVVGDGAPW